MGRTVSMCSDSAELVLDLDAGCRLASLRVLGHELLVTEPIEQPAALTWGAFPMAPWAGRTRRGRFTFRGVEHTLPVNLGEHAVHGTVFDRPWEPVSDVAFETDLGESWPFPGSVRHEVELGEEGVELRLEVRAEAGPMPATCGWHPWFRRVVAGSAGRPVIEADYMLQRDHEGVATRRRVEPPPGPWDDCLGGLHEPPRVAWPGVLSVEVRSTCEYVVVFDERTEAICVEPQTAPPDSLNHDPLVVTPGRPLTARSTWAWSLG